MALTKAKLMELIDNGDIDVGGGGFNPNLLHNWDFRNPVNQRGGTWFSGANVYGLDRWMNPAWGGAYGWDVSGFVTNAGGITQRIERSPGLEGKIATLSWCVSGKIYSTTFTMPSIVGTAATVSSVIMDDGVIVMPYVPLTSSYMGVGFGVGNVSSGWQMVKLELGTVSTLAYDPPMDYGTELAKCQRFYEVIGDGHYFLAYDAAYCTVSFPFVIEKRVTPTLVALVGALSLTDTIADYTASNFTIVSSSLNTRGLKRAVLGGWSNLTVGKAYYLAANYTRLFGFSSDL